jgi:hypothetical protein
MDAHAASCQTVTVMRGRRFAAARANSYNPVSSALSLFFIIFLKYCCLKGLPHEIYWPVFWHVWVNLGLKVNRFLVQNCSDATSIFGSYSSFNAFHTKPTNLQDELTTGSAVLQFSFFLG